MNRWVEVPASLSAESAERFRSSLDEALTDASGPVVLRGTSAVFSRGVSLEAIAAGDEPEAPVRTYARALEAILLSSVPTISVVEGPAVGGGVGLAAATDLVIATRASSFALPELLYGLLPVIILPALERRMSARDITAFAATGLARGPEQALSAGLVDHLVEEADVDRALGRAMREHSRVDSDALTHFRRALLDPDALRARLDAAVAATIARLEDPTVLRRIERFVKEGRAPWTSN